MKIAYCFWDSKRRNRINKRGVSSRISLKTSCLLPRLRLHVLARANQQLFEAFNTYARNCLRPGTGTETFFILIHFNHFFQRFMNFRCTKYCHSLRKKQPQIRAECSFGSIEAPAKGERMAWNRASVPRCSWNTMSSRHRQVETPAHRDALQSTYMTKRFTGQCKPISMDRIKEPNITTSSHNT